MEYLNYDSFRRCVLLPSRKLKIKFCKSIFLTFSILYMHAFALGQCPVVDPMVCEDIVISGAPINTFDITCANDVFEVCAGGLYRVNLPASNSYLFSLVAVGSNSACTNPTLQSGVIKLFDDQLQTNLVATSNGVTANTSLMPSELEFVNGAETEFFLSVLSHSCALDWSSYTLTITCNNNPCNITSPTTHFISANETGCLSEESNFNVNSSSECVNGTFSILSDEGIGATINNNGAVTIPAGLSFGSYDVVVGVDDCGGNQKTTTTTVAVAPVFGCQARNVTLNPSCQIDISGFVLNGVCADSDQFTIFINNIQTNIVTEVGVHNYEVFYTPDANTSIPLCWNTITVEDKSGPTCNLTTADQEYNFVCGFESAPITPTFTDCSGTVVANEVIELSIGNCGEIDGITDGDNDLFDDLPITTMGVTIPVPTEAEAGTLHGAGFALEKVLVNIYSASDGINTGSACEQFIYIFRPTAIVLPGSAFVTCGLETTPTALAALDPQLVPYYVNPLFGDDNSDMNDFSGTGVEEASFTPTKVDDAGNPQFVAIAGQDHSVCAFTVTSEDTQATNPCGMTSKFVRRYSVLDCCSNVIVLDNESQYIETVDNVAPVFTNCPEVGDLGSISNPRIEEINASNTCATTIDFAAITPSATDECSDVILSPVTYSATFFSVADDFSGIGTLVANGMSPSLGKGKYRAEVTATDDCGNISETCFVYIQVDDKVVPSVQCSSAAISVDNNGNAQVCAIDRAIADDNCGTIANLEVKLMEQDDNTFSSCINVSCVDAVDNGTGVLVFNLVYRATDESGNSNISMCPSELQIKTAPQFTCPIDVSVECSAYSSTTNYGEPTISGQCGRMFNTSFTDAAGMTSCAGTGTVIRTFSLSMNNVEIATCDQTITLEDKTAPTFDNAPMDASAECSDLPDGTLITASDECSSATVTFVDVTTDGMCIDSYTIARTFTATDECGNTALFTQTITVVDTTNPVFTSVPDDVAIACGNIPAVQTATATDNCDGDVTITVSDSDATTMACPANNSFIRTYTATDNCGNSTTYEQTITLLYVPAMVEFEPANNRSLDCDLMDGFVFAPPTFITFTDSPCGESNLIVSEVVIETDPADANGSIEVRGTYTVTNDCGLSVSRTTTITFIDCCLDVNVTGISAVCETDGNSTIMVTVQLDPANDIPEADLTFVATNMDDSADVVTSVGNQNLLLDKFKVYTITVTPTGTESTICNPPVNTFGCFVSRISGRIFNEELTPLEEVEVELMNTEIPMSMTNVKGEYSFENIPDQGYSVAAHKENDPFNGISTYDLVVMAQHVLGVQELSSPYKLIAADINMDQTIDILDMLELRQLILYAIEDFSVNTSWRFVNANYIFPDPTNPWLETIPELHNLEALRTDAELDFIAVKIGDLDCSAETKGNLTDTNVTPRENNILVLETKQQTVKAGTTFEVALQPNQNVNLSALQFTLDFDPSLATLSSLNSTVLDQQDIAINEMFAQEGQVPFVWYNQQDVSLDSDQSITFTFEAKRDFDLDEFLDINSSLTKAAAYSSTGTGYNLAFEMLDQLDSSAKYTLYQNQPNPFQAETVIGFDVEQDEEVRLTVFNLEGKMLYNAEFTAQAGYNSVVISKEELQTTGVLFYQLDAADYTTTKKMILLE